MSGLAVRPQGPYGLALSPYQKVTGRARASGRRIGCRCDPVRVCGHGAVRPRQGAAAGATAGCRRGYLFLLHHRLELYAGASRDLAALFSASDAIEAAEFSAFVAASRVFERLEGIRAFGYLPRVPAADAARFEADMRRQVPDFHLVAPRPGVRDYYPMVYGEHAFDPGRMKAL
ncbi:MAG TPA: CHASE domain-containing protein, partial [Pseudoduganella sp.]